MKWVITWIGISMAVYGQPTTSSPKGTEGDRLLPIKQERIRKVKGTLQRLTSYPLSPQVHETSGLVFFDGLFWTHNDDQDSTLYGLDAQGNIQKKITLLGVINRDWEALEQDDTHLYIGDFGNNSQGNSTQLQLLKIDKKTLYTARPQIDTIAFRYADQTDFSPQKGNSTAFDCEAFIVTPDRLYLFTKAWDGGLCKVYVLPNQAGTQVATLHYRFDSKGLITDACYLPQQQLLLLCGYTKLLRPYLLRFRTFDPQNFESALVEEIKLPLLFHQIEAITSLDGTTLYLTNETLIKPPLVNTPAQWHELVWKN